MKNSRNPFMEAHQEVFGIHLRKHSQLHRHYWWSEMSANIKNWCHACLVCASHSMGRPPLTPIPILVPFNSVDADVLKLPRSQQDPSYAVVFIDYLSKWPEIFATRWTYQFWPLPSYSWKRWFAGMVCPTSFCLIVILHFCLTWSPKCADWWTSRKPTQPHILREMASWNGSTGSS